jgi:glutaminyl-peptide cyclotransferase
MGAWMGAFRVQKWLTVGAVLVVITNSGCANTSAGNEDAMPSMDFGAAMVPTLVPTVIAEVPHDKSASTEGLVFDGPRLYESTGKVGRSQLRELDPATGEAIRKADLPPEFYGEGLAVVGDRIWQLTWKNGVAIEWDKSSMKPLRPVRVEGQGWGLCYDGNRLIRSDGTDRLHFHDPATFTETGSVAVTFQGGPLRQLNELECVGGQIWANVFMTDRIVRIDPETGNITAMVDARRLVDDTRRAKGEVLNGIAFAGNDEYVLTGKYWPTSFRVRLDG